MDNNNTCFIIKENEEGNKYIERKNEERKNEERNIKVNLIFEKENGNEAIKEITQLMTKMYVNKIINQ